MARFEIHVLVNAGAPYRGRWAPLPYHFGNEADALAMVEKFRDRDRWAAGIARSYRVVQKAEATVDDICRELDGYMAELNAGLQVQSLRRMVADLEAWGPNASPSRAADLAHYRAELAKAEGGR